MDITGCMISGVLDSFDEPATMTMVISGVADQLQVSRAAIKNEVKKTLDGGVKFGFIKKYKNKYCIDDRKRKNRTPAEHPLLFPDSSQTSDSELAALETLDNAQMSTVDARESLDLKWKVAEVGDTKEPIKEDQAVDEGACGEVLMKKPNKTRKRRAGGWTVNRRRRR